jgi:integration host factor subunit alpha
LSRIESAALVEMVLDRISDALLAGDNVKISSFGSFMLREKGLRIGRNPKTGVEVPIQPRTVLTFRPSQLLREAINEKA